MFMLFCPPKLSKKLQIYMKRIIFCRHEAELFVFSLFSINFLGENVLFCREEAVIDTGTTICAK